ncbi:hypothetical protein [Clostridium perfringens]|uniref:hypothetical protein n=1 Tax=Clostridium perfringens TaxID=1502 RepID=UPI0039EBC1A5
MDILLCYANFNTILKQSHNKIDRELEKIEKAEEEVTSETIGVIDIEVHDDDSK